MCKSKIPRNTYRRRFGHHWSPYSPGRLRSGSGCRLRDGSRSASGYIYYIWAVCNLSARQSLPLVECIHRSRCTWCRSSPEGWEHRSENNQSIVRYYYARPCSSLMDTVCTSTGSLTELPGFLSHIDSPLRGLWTPLTCHKYISSCLGPLPLCLPWNTRISRAPQNGSSSSSSFCSQAPCSQSYWYRTRSFHLVPPLYFHTLCYITPSGLGSCLISTCSSGCYQMAANSSQSMCMLSYYRHKLSLDMLCRKFRLFASRSLIYKYTWHLSLHLMVSHSLDISDSPVGFPCIFDDRNWSTFYVRCNMLKSYLILISTFLLKDNFHIHNVFIVFFLKPWENDPYTIISLIYYRLKKFTLIL